MIKEKLFYSIRKRQEAKNAKKFAHAMLAHNFGTAYTHKLFEHNIRRRMKIKAERLGIKAGCHECRTVYRDEGGVPVELLHLENKGYFPFDRYTCRRCIWYMRGGMH